MKRLVIMRGVPGSGKSTRAMEVAGGDDGCIFSADKYFVRDGVYRFDMNEIWPAHKQCRIKSSEAMAAGRPLVIIDNTNIRVRDIKPYAKEGLKHGYEVTVEYPTSEWWVRLERLLRNRDDNWPRLLKVADMLAGKNVHGVNRETIISMMEKWQFLDDLPARLELWRGEPEDVLNDREPTTGPPATGSELQA
jgi:hypothetical protein